MRRACSSVLVGLLVSFGCTSSLETFVCESDNQCMRRGEMGECSAEQLCTFSDDACASGRRYGEASGERSNRCTEESGDGGVFDAARALYDASPPETGCGLVESEFTIVEANGNSFHGLGADRDNLYILTRPPDMELPSFVGVYALDGGNGGVNMALPNGFAAAAGLTVHDDILYVTNGKEPPQLRRLDLTGQNLFPLIDMNVSRSDGLAVLDGVLYNVGEKAGSVVVERVDLQTGDATTAFIVDAEVIVEGLDSDGQHLYYTSKPSECASGCEVTLHKVTSDGTEICRSVLDGVQVGPGVAVNDTGIFVVVRPGTIRMYSLP